MGGYFQDEKIWQHYRFVIRVEKVLSVVYLFGREEFFQDPKDGGWTARATGSPRRSRTDVAGEGLARASRNEQTRGQASRYLFA